MRVSKDSEWTHSLSDPTLACPYQSVSSFCGSAFVACRTDRILDVSSPSSVMVVRDRCPCRADNSSARLVPAEARLKLRIANRN
jgi:hypothetical protein